MLAAAGRLLAQLPPTLALTGLMLASSPAAPASAAPERAAMVMDANTGKVLYASNADALRYPASLTKMMTLYLTFELIEKGRLDYADRLPISAQASAQPPSKLDLDAGDSISVRDAVRALVTKSANDIAVALAERIGGSEQNFARLMTRKAREIGMSKTVFRNASGLPNEEQVTTARDMLTLALRLQDDFPEHYGVFATKSFSYAGKRYRNHNTLLYHYRGTDGIKTGYTRASGFNLVTSVHREGRHLIAAVFGGKSAGSRNAEMRTLLDRAFAKASTRRTRKTTPKLVAQPRAVARPVARVATATPPALAPASAPLPVQAPPSTSSPLVQQVATADAAPVVAPPATAEPAPAPASFELARVRTVAIADHLDDVSDRTNGGERDALAALVRTATAPPPPSAPPQSVTSASAASASPVTVTSPDQPASTGAAYTTAPTALPASPAGPDTTGDRAEVPSAQSVGTAPESETRGRPPSTLHEQLARILAEHRPDSMASGTDQRPPLRATIAEVPDRGSPQGPFQIQVGAYATPAEAERQLQRVRDEAARWLQGASTLTEPVISGQRRFYRARFAGFDSDGASRACLELRRRSIDCMVTRAR